MKCPICKKKMKYWSDYMDQILLEEESKCIQCGYHEYFGFGGYGVRIGNQYWEWNYQDDWKLKQQYDTEIAIEIIYCRCLKWLGLK